MAQVIALKSHRYANKARAVGVEYDIAGPSALRLYQALGWVRPTGAAAPAPAPRVAAPVAEPPPVKRGPGRPRKTEYPAQYNRRDLVAIAPPVLVDVVQEPPSAADAAAPADE